MQCSSYHHFREPSLFSGSLAFLHIILCYAVLLLSLHVEEGVKGVILIPASGGRG